MIPFSNFQQAKCTGASNKQKEARSTPLLLDIEIFSTHIPTPTSSAWLEDFKGSSGQSRIGIEARITPCSIFFPPLTEVITVKEGTLCETRTLNASGWVIERYNECMILTSPADPLHLTIQQKKLVHCSRQQIVLIVV